MDKRNFFALLRTFVFAAFVPAISLSLVSCDPENGDDGGGGVTPVISVPDGYENYFIEDLSFSRLAGEVEVAFQINVAWTMEVVASESASASWLSVEPASGSAGLHKVTVRVTDNDTYESRSAKIHLLCGTTKIAEVAVTQDYENALLLSRNIYNVSYEATTINVELKSNVDFEYEVLDADWVRISADATRGLATHNLVFDVDENDRRTERKAHILFYNSEYAVADTTLTLVQEGNPDGLPYEAIDLGLSVKWASCNVGADSPEDYGDYFAWGDTEEKDYYSWSTYKWCNGSSDTLTKYCTSSSYGTVDGKNILDPEDDAATANWGSPWRMPTRTEIEELIDDCAWSWTTQNGVNGYKVTGSNGNSIFLPAAGNRDGTEVYASGSFGCYWSGMLYKNYDEYVYTLNFTGSYWIWLYSLRSAGHTVRPVTE